MDEKLFGNDDPDVQILRMNFASLLANQGKAVGAEAEPLAREALAVQRKLYSKENPVVAFSIYSLADLLVREGNKLAEAESLLREALAMQRKFFGDEHQDVARSLAGLANVLSMEGRSAEAEPLFQEALEMRRHLLGTESSDVAWSLFNLGSFLYYQGRWDAAEKALREALDIRRKLYASDPEVLDVLDLLAMTLAAQGRLLEAEALARECLARREKKMPDDWHTCSTQSLLGSVLLGQKKYSEETERLLLTAYDGMNQRENTMPAYARPRLRETLQRLVQLYGETNRPDQVAEWKQKLSEFDKTPK
jgi:tetratricopeptide (TPR) repeat protein